MSVWNSPILNRTPEMFKYGGGSFHDLVHTAPAYSPATYFRLVNDEISNQSIEIDSTAANSTTRASERVRPEILSTVTLRFAVTSPMFPWGRLPTDIRCLILKAFCIEIACAYEDAFDNSKDVLKRVELSEYSLI